MAVLVAVTMAFIMIAGTISFADQASDAVDYTSDTGQLNVQLSEDKKTLTFSGRSGLGTFSGGTPAERLDERLSAWGLEGRLDDFTGIENLVLEFEITGISAYAFENFSSVETLSILVGVREVGSNAFDGMSSLREISVDSSNQYFASQRSALVAYIDNGGDRTDRAHATGIEVVRVPEAAVGSAPTNATYAQYTIYVMPVGTASMPTKVVAAGAMKGCIKIGGLHIPDTVTAIGDGAFEGCSILKAVRIYNATTTLGENAFKDCLQLELVALGTGITSLQAGTFSGCTALRGVYVAGAVTGIASAFDEGKRDWSVIEWTSGTSYTHSTTATGFTAKGLYMMTSDNPDQVRGSGQVWIGTTTVDLGAGNSSGDRYAHLMPDDHGDLNSYTGTRACYIMMPENVGSKESGLQSPSGVNISTIWAEHNRVCTIEYFPSTFYGLSATQNAVREFVVSPLNDRLASIDGDLYIVNGSSPKLHAFADRNAGNLVVLSENANTSFYTFSDISAGMVEDAYTTNAGNQTTYQINIALMRSDASTFQARSGNAAGGVDIVVLGPDVGTYIYSNEKGSTNTWLITEPSTSGTPITLHAMSFTDGTWMDSAGNFYVSKTNNGLYKVSPTPDGQGRYPLAKQTTLPHGLVMKRIGNAPTITDNTIAQYPTGDLGLVDFESASGVQGKYLKYTYRGYTGLIVFADGKLENIPNVGANYLTLMGGIQADGSIGSLTTIGSTVLDGFSDRSSVKGIMLSYTVTTLESQCFAGAGIKYMYIPKSVTSIADDAFKGCASMYRYIVDVHNTVYTSAPVGTGAAGAKTVKDETFMIYHMTDGVVDRLVAVPAARTGGLDIPSTVTAVAPYAAYGSSLSSVSFNNVETIGDYAFYRGKLNGASIPNAQVVGAFSFYGAADILNIIIGTNCQSIGDRAFYVSDTSTSKCSFIFIYPSEDIDLSVGESIFPMSVSKTWYRNGLASEPVTESPSGTIFSFNRGVYWITSVASFSYIGENMTYYYHPESSVLIISGTGYMYDTYEEAEDYPWGDYRTAVKSVILNRGVDGIGDYAFQSFTNSNLDLVIPAGIKSIGKHAFDGARVYGTPDLVEVVTIGESAFLDCTRVQGAVNLTNVGSLGASAFKGCSSLEKVSLGGSLTSIGASAFEGCTSLEGIDILSSTGFSRSEACFATGHSGGTTVSYSFSDPSFVFNPTYDRSATYSSETNSYVYIPTATIYYHETSDRIIPFSYERGTSIRLPEPAQREGYTFLGWYSDSSYSSYVGPAGGTCQPGSISILYAYFQIQLPATIVWQYVLDGDATDITTIKSKIAGGSEFFLPTILYDQGYVIATPAPGYSFALSSQDVDVERFEGGLFRLSLSHTMENARITFECSTEPIAYDDIRITSLTSGGRGAVIEVNSASMGGIESGTVHLGGVYFKTMGSGPSAVVAYGVVTDTVLEIKEGESYESMDDGIMTDEGSSYQSMEIRLQDEDCAFSTLYAYLSTSHGTVYSKQMRGGSLV